MKKHKSLIARMGAVVILAGAMVVTSVVSADAAFKLKLDDGLGPAVVLTIEDNTIDDLDSDFSSISRVADYGNFDVAVITGTSSRRNSDGSASSESAKLNTTSIIVKNKGPAGTLTLTLTDTGFVNGGASIKQTLAVSDVTGTGSSVSYQSFADAGNNEFTVAPGPLVSVTPVVAVVAPATVTSSTAFSPFATPFSLTTVTTITLAADGTTNLSATTLVPEPGMLALFGAGLLGFGRMVRRRRLA